MAADPAETRTPRWSREVLGAVAAAAIAVTVVAVVASGPRSELLFRDADSLVTTLVARSLASGQPQDWAMSTVLFVPESALVVLLSLFGLGVSGTLALAAVVTLLGLYAALRVAAGSAGAGRAPVAGALLALSAFGLLAVTETSPSRDALEPASLMLTTTYYSATVIATVLAVGIVRRALDRPGRRRHGWILAAVAAASVFTNPLFAAWATVPVVVVLGVVALGRSRGGSGVAADRAVALRMIAALVVGSLAGLVLRLPLGRLIANSGAGYADPSRWLESVGYYGALVADRAGTLAGVLALAGGRGRGGGGLGGAVGGRRGVHGPGRGWVVSRLSSSCAGGRSGRPWWRPAEASCRCWSWSVRSCSARTPRDTSSRSRSLRSSASWCCPSFCDAGAPPVPARP